MHQNIKALKAALEILGTIIGIGFTLWAIAKFYYFLGGSPSPD